MRCSYDSNHIRVSTHWTLIMRKQREKISFSLNFIRLNIIDWIQYMNVLYDWHCAITTGWAYVEGGNGNCRIGRQIVKQTQKWQNKHNSQCFCATDSKSAKRWSKNKWQHQVRRIYCMASFHIKDSSNSHSWMLHV